MEANIGEKKKGKFLFPVVIISNLIFTQQNRIFSVAVNHITKWSRRRFCIRNKDNFITV
jgi:hypothetical protein